MLLCIYAMCNVCSLLLKQSYSQDTEEFKLAILHRAPSLTVIIDKSVNETILDKPEIGAGKRTRCPISRRSIEYINVSLLLQTSIRLSYTLALVVVFCYVDMHHKYNVYSLLIIKQKTIFDCCFRVSFSHLRTTKNKAVYYFT